MVYNSNSMLDDFKENEMKQGNLKVINTPSGTIRDLVAEGTAWRLYNDGTELSPYSKEGVLELIQSGYWELILPEEFDFVLCDELDFEYHVKRVGEDYAVTWPDCYTPVNHSVWTVSERLVQGKWLMKEIPVQEPNGFDAEGNPLNFTEDDLQLFQRVELENGQVCVVAPNCYTDVSGNRAKFALVQKDFWVPWDLSGKDTPAPIAVYSAPIFNLSMLNPKVFGNLIWTSKDYENNKRKKELEDTITAKQREVEALMSELNSL